MKNNFAKKIIKISSAVFLSFFLFALVKAEPQEFNLEEQLDMSSRAKSTTEIEQPSPDNDQENSGINDIFEDPSKGKVIDNKSKDYSGERFTYTLLQPLPQEGKDLQENVTLKQYLTWAFRFALALAGFLAVMMIVIGGVEWIISGANEASRSDAKKRINSAISGLVLALVSYLVLYTINPSLVDFKNNQFFKEKETTNSEE